MSWNIHSCIGTDGRYDPGRIAGVLERLDADVIGLQEVDWRKPRVDGRDQLDYLAHVLKMTPVEGPNLQDHHGHYGNGLLTRLAVDRVDRVEIAQPGREPRGLIDVSLRTDRWPVRSLVTHLGLSRRERRRQMHAIAAHLASTTPDAAPLVCMGDFNEWLPVSCARVLGPGSVCSLEASPRTFPSYVPFLRLDRILLREDARAHAVQVDIGRHRRTASDHRPVCVDLVPSPRDAAHAS